MFEFGGLTIVLLVIGLLAASLRILREYERGVVFMLGRFWKVKGPGLVVILPGIQQMVRMDLRTVVFDVPSQDVISRDNVSVKVSAVVFFRVIDPAKSILQVEDYLNATSQLAQTTLRAVLGKHELDDMLAERERLNQDIQQLLDAQTDAWGIKVSNVEIKHVDIDETMVRAIAKQAEAEHERRAKVIQPKVNCRPQKSCWPPPRSSPAGRRRCSCAICRRSPTSPATGPIPSFFRCRAN